MRDLQCSKLSDRTRRSKTFAGLLLVITLVGWVPSARASAPEWLREAARMTLPKYPEDTNAVVLLDEQITTVNDSGEIKTLYRVAYKILRPEGRERGTVGVYFDSETRLTYLKAWSIPATGNEYEVKEKDAAETSPFAGFLYQDTRYKILRIPASGPGTVVGYEYEQKRRPFILHDTWRFQNDIPVRRARFTLRLPKGWEYKTFWQNHTPLKPQTNGETEIVWELQDLPGVEPEAAMPAWRALAGRMAVTYFPRQGKGGGESGGSWRDIGLWHARLTEGRRQATPEIRQKVAELTVSAATPLEKIRALAAFAQKEIRYLAIEIGIGGYQPHPAQDIFTNRYGDCKDKVTLLSTMLREIGVESYYVLVHTERGIVVPDLPTALTFNHVILAIRVPKDVPTVALYSVKNHEKLGAVLFFDPTDLFTPFGFLPPYLQANYGLLVTGESGELVQLPLIPPPLNRLLRVGKLALGPDGNLVGAVQEIRWGAPARETRLRMKDIPETEQIKLLENFLGTTLGGVVLQGAGIQNLQNVDGSLTLSYQFLARDYAKAAGDLLLVRPRVLGQKSRNLFEEKERKYPVEFANASLESDMFDITLPQGYKVDELPPPTQVSSAFGEYQSKVEVSANILQYRRNFTIKDIRVPTERLAELKQFFQQIAADERAIAVLKRSGP